MAERLDSLRFEVPGIPVPQGATNPGQVADYPALMEWRNAVTVVARAARRGRWAPIAPPECVRVIAAFRMPPRKTGRWAGAQYPGGAPDLDKLCRAVGDAMQTAGVFLDDAQVVDWLATKRWVDPLRRIGAGVDIVVIPLGVAR